MSKAPSVKVERAAMRDASWYVNPGRASKYHVLRDTDENGNLGAYECDAGTCCGIRFTVRDYDTVAVENVPAYMRCGRPGCASRWPSELAS